MNERLNTGIKYALLAALVAAMALGGTAYQSRGTARSKAQQAHYESSVKPRLEAGKDCIPSKDNLCLTMPAGALDFSFTYIVGWPLRFMITRETYQTQSLSRRPPEIKMFWGGLAADFLIFFSGSIFILMAAGAVLTKRRSRGQGQRP
jgi:hypothetical protein